MSLCLLSPGFSLAENVPAPINQTTSTPSSQTPAQTIPFKQESQGLAAQAGKSVAMLLLAIGVAAAMLYAVKKYLPKIAPSMATGKRLQLIEVLRLTPKTTLFLVQFDGATLLLGQQGESINVIEARSQIPEAVTTPQSE